MVVLYAHLIWIWTACLVRKSFINTSSITCHAGLLFQDKNLLTGVIAGVVTLVALKLKDSGYERFTLVVQTNCIRLMQGWCNSVSQPWLCKQVIPSLRCDCYQQHHDNTTVVSRSSQPDNRNEFPTIHPIPAVQVTICNRTFTIANYDADWLCLCSKTSWVVNLHLGQ